MTIILPSFLSMAYHLWSIFPSPFLVSDKVHFTIAWPCTTGWLLSPIECSVASTGTKYIESLTSIYTYFSSNSASWLLILILFYYTLLITCIYVHAIFHDVLPIQSLSIMPIFGGSSIIVVQQRMQCWAIKLSFLAYMKSTPSSTAPPCFDAFHDRQSNAKKFAMLSAWPPKKTALLYSWTMLQGSRPSVLILLPPLVLEMISRVLSNLTKWLTGQCLALAPASPWEHVVLFSG